MMTSTAYECVTIENSDNFSDARHLLAARLYVMCMCVSDAFINSCRKRQCGYRHHVRVVTLVWLFVTEHFSFVTKKVKDGTEPFRCFVRPK